MRSKPVWEAALADEVRKSEQVGRDAGEGIITYSPVSDADQRKFDRVYLREGEANARALSRFGIDGLKAYRRARGSVVARDRIECGGNA